MHAYCMVVLTFITAAKKHVYQLCFLPFIDSFCRDNTNVYIYTHTDIHQHVYIYKYKDIYLYIICVCVFKNLPGCIISKEVDCNHSWTSWYRTSCYRNTWRLSFIFAYRSTETKHNFFDLRPGTQQHWEIVISQFESDCLHVVGHK